MIETDGRALGRYAATVLIGVLIGLVGTLVHRWEQPWGLVLALGSVLSAGLLVRAWSGWVGMLLLALGVVTMLVHPLLYPAGETYLFNVIAGALITVLTIGTEALPRNRSR